MSKTFVCIFDDGTEIWTLAPTIRSAAANAEAMYKTEHRALVGVHERADDDMIPWSKIMGITYAISEVNNGG